MAVREIVKIGHPALTKKAAAVESIDQEILDLARDMVETMYAAPGVGLAATQVNVGKRIITIDLSLGEDPDALIVLVNPEIVGQEGLIVSEEGCLSVPDIREKVARPSKVFVKGLNLGGKDVRMEGLDLLARAICHEIDHLDGRLFIERLSPLKKALVKKKIQKYRQKSAGR